MKNKAIFIVVVIIAIVGFMWWNNSQTETSSTNINADVNKNIEKDTNTNTSPTADSSPSTEVKEFVMTSFYELVDDKPKPQFSLKEINVKKGDRVRIKVTNTKGGHDFKIDEYDIYKETPLDQEVIIEFTADKVGEFIYYCNQPNHRALGHLGTLRVTE